MQKWIVQGLTPILCGFTLLLAVIGAGRAARAALYDRAAYRLAFADIDCQSPEGMSRVAFLNEVRSLARQPATLRLLDEDLTTRLHRAFLAHPWVESVRRVAVDHTFVRVEMEYRQAVLAVPRADGGWRTVDHCGILLPESPVPPHLPVLLMAAANPTGPTGSHWGDARVSAAARTAAFLQSHLDRLHLEGSCIEIIEGEIVFLKPGLRIVWGHAPGQEKDDEAPAQVKLRRLLDYQKEHDGLEGLEHDVRLLAYQGHFPLPPEGPQTSVALYKWSPSTAKMGRGPVSNSGQNWRSCFNNAKPPSAGASSR
jgi:hypothetical protein